MEDLHQRETVLHITKQNFNEICLYRKSRKAKNTQLFTREEYYSILDDVKAAEGNTYKSFQDYKLLSKYDIVNIGNTQKLIVRKKDMGESEMYYTYIEEIFDIIHNTYNSVKEEGRSKVECRSKGEDLLRVKLYRELEKKYKNITHELITIYLNLRHPNKYQYINKDKENVPTVLISRCQVDLVDMQSDGQYNFIMVYQDHLTKFVQLRPLKSKDAVEVGDNLLELFTIFGAPCILHSNNGREFANNVINEVCKKWDNLKIVCGNLQHSQSQVSVDQDIRIKLGEWLEKNRTKPWSEGLRFTQLMINVAFHSEINKSPYEAMFGCKPKIGLKTFLPAVDISRITSEQDLCDILQNTVDYSDAQAAGTHSEKIESKSQGDREICTNQEDPEEVSSDVDSEETIIDTKVSSTIVTDEKSLQEFGSTSSCPQKQAEETLEGSNIKFPNVTFVATVIDKQENFAKKRIEYRICTWNVNGGLEIKKPDLVKVFNEEHLDALCVTDTRRKGSGIEELHDRVMALWSGVHQDDHASAGVGILLSSRLASGMKGYGLVGPRLLWVRLKLGMTQIFLVAAYAPISSEIPQVLGQFWASMNNTLDLAEGHERLIVCGDLNGWVGTQRDGYETVLGPFGDERVNNAGKPILDLCTTRNLIVSNTLFKHKDIHTYTWRQKDKKSVIDLILVDSRLRDVIKDTRVYEVPTLATDHFLVVSKIEINCPLRDLSESQELCERILTLQLL